MDLVEIDPVVLYVSDMAAPVRYGVIGTGMMGCEHLRNIAALPDGTTASCWPAVTSTPCSSPHRTTPTQTSRVTCSSVAPTCT